MTAAPRALLRRLLTWWAPTPTPPLPPPRDVRAMHATPTGALALPPADALPLPSPQHPHQPKRLPASQITSCTAHPTHPQRQT